MSNHVRGIEERPIVDNGVDRKDFVYRKERTITWNADNMPTTVIRQAGGSPVTTYFDYDGQGRRAIKSTGGDTTYYISKEFEIINGASTMYNIYAGNLRVAKRVSGSPIHYFHKDRLGSSTVMTNAAGTAVEGTEYMPFGNQREHLGSQISDYKFTDQELDGTTGFYNYDARLYDPVIGRFISTDSIVTDIHDPQTLNRYAYCRNNPIKYTDPSGHWIGIDDVFTGPVDEIAVLGFLGIAAYGFGNKAALDTLNKINEKLESVFVKDKIPNEDLSAPPSKRGNAPIGKDGHPVELHHPDQEDTDEREELTRADHRGKGNFKKNHPNVGQRPSKIDRQKSKKDHKDYWEKEMDKGRFDNFNDKIEDDQSDSDDQLENDDFGDGGDVKDEE